MTRSKQHRFAVFVAAALLVAPASGLAGNQTPDPLNTNIQCRTDPSQTYTLYLPESAAQDNLRPALLILDPRGRSEMAAALFKAAADRYQWILVSSDTTRSDGPMEPNHRALAALWAELNSGRWPIDRQRLYAAGFSGGAHFSWMLGTRTDGLAGVIASGGRHLPEFIQDATFSHFGAAGSTDFNNSGMRLVDEQLAKQGNAHRLEVFDGRHQWMPPELAFAAATWMEIDAMKRALRDIDDGIVDETMTADIEAAQMFIDQGRLLDAQRRYASTADTFDGLRDVTALRRRADELSTHPKVRAAIKEERRLAVFEDTVVARMFNACAELRESKVPVPAGRFENELQIKLLEKMARTESLEGVTARRLLATIFTQTSFYLTRDLMSAGAYDKAAVALAAASRIEPEDSTVWYNLACALAAGGKTEKALDALETSIATGFSNQVALAEDPDLDSLRDRQRFNQIIGSVLP